MEEEDGEAPDLFGDSGTSPWPGRREGVAWKLVNMILGTDGHRNDPALKATPCPACGAVGGFRQHSSYRHC